LGQAGGGSKCKRTAAGIPFAARPRSADESNC
jgi:hypothetical protein